MSVDAPVAGKADGAAIAIAESLMEADRKAVLLGNAAAHHANASGLLALANWIAEQTGSSIGYLTEATNTVGAQLAGALPGSGGLNAGEMLAGDLSAVLLFNTEPEFDSAAGAKAVPALDKVEMVVSLSPFKANMAFSDVLLPIAPFTETSGTFVNAEGRVQSFHAVVKPLADTRPGWKVLRVLANMLELPGFDQESTQDVLKGVDISAQRLYNGQALSFDSGSRSGPDPVSASIYQLDGIVRRAASLQLTADARAAVIEGVAVLAEILARPRRVGGAQTAGGRRFGGHVPQTRPQKFRPQTDQIRCGQNRL